MIPAEWSLQAAVLGLVICALAAAGLVRRYQEYKALQRSRVRRIASAVPIVERSLNDLKGVPLGKPLRVALRGDVYARYRLVAREMSRFPNIQQLIAEARRRLDAEGEPLSPSVPPIEDEAQFGRFTAGLDALVGYLQNGGPVDHLRTDQRLEFIQELQERRAEVVARFHIVQAHRLHEHGDLRAARQHLQTLMKSLQARGPNTEFVRALYHEAADLHTEYLTTGSGAGAVTSR